MNNQDCSEGRDAVRTKRVLLAKIALGFAALSVAFVGWSVLQIILGLTSHVG